MSFSLTPPLISLSQSLKAYKLGAKVEKKERENKDKTNNVSFKTPAIYMKCKS
jgi:hypothetical protein